MPVSPHLHRKLREALGADAGDDLVNLLEVVEATRGDVAELRHAVDVKLPALKFEVIAAIEKGLKEQTRFFFLAWAVLLAAIVGIYAP